MKEAAGSIALHMVQGSMRQDCGSKLIIDNGQTEASIRATFWDSIPIIDAALYFYDRTSC